MVISIASIPVSLFLKSPFETISDAHMVRYTGPSLHTLHANLWPHFTAGAAGSGLGHNQREGWQSTFAVLFPACTGILAGASMSGDLRKPSKSISKGTFAGLGATFTIYVVALLCMACSIKRETFREDLSILQDVRPSDLTGGISEESNTTHRSRSRQS
jgi:potassium/chloride transporter 9